MKKITYILPILISLLFINSCGIGGRRKKDKGNLVGIKGKSWFPEKPPGMTLIPSGAFVVGKSNYDQINSDNAPVKTISVNAFYMDETEITNGEYRQFVQWVKDSIARTILAEKAGNVSSEDKKGLGYYAYKGSGSKTEKNSKKGAYYEYINKNNDGRNNVSMPSGKKIDWDKDLIWNVEDYPSVEYAEAIEQLYYPIEDRIGGERAIDVRKLKYSYHEYDFNSIHEKVDKKSRTKYVINKSVNIYPDTTVWAKDFKYSYNEPMHAQYFWHDSYSDYPVVGVNWNQAKAFAAWRTKYKNDYQKSKKKSKVFPFRLPTESEWEYAARGGIDNAEYPWGGPYTTDSRGCFLANYKPKRGDYLADGAMYTTKAKSFTPNDYNLYNMAGNVSEWTISSFDQASYYRYSSLNPNLDVKNSKKSIRGGSWKDVAYYLQVSTRDWEYADSARSYIGFRTVQDYPNGFRTK